MKKRDEYIKTIYNSLKLKRQKVDLWVVLSLVKSFINRIKRKSTGLTTV